MPSWGNIVKEIQKERDDPGGESASDKVRHKYLMKLHDHNGRNVICYYSGFLAKPKIEGIDINDEDKHGFMDCVGGLDRTKGVDLFIHTPGGNVAATESLINYLKKMFGNDIRAVVPQIAMSAGTLIACACDEIIMGKHSNLGPVDPQIYGFSAYAVINEVETAYNEIKSDANRAHVWHSILSRYTPGFVQLCHYAVQNSDQLLDKFLRENMFSTLPNGEQDRVVSKIVKNLTDLNRNKSHDRHIHIEECQDMGLKILELEDPNDKTFQDLVLSVHHCFMYALSNTNVFKIIENHVGRRYMKAIMQQPNIQFMIPAAPIPSQFGGQ